MTAQSSSSASVLNEIKVVVVSFGTRTLQRVLHQSRNARLMKDACWGDRSGRYERLEHSLLQYCMGDLVASRFGDDTRCVASHFVDCRPLWRPKSDQGHVGLHADLQVQYQNQSSCRQIYRGCKEAVAGLTALIQNANSISRGGVKMVAVVGFYCNAGEHRSVAMAEVFKRYLDSSQFTAETCHSCDSVWRRKFCQGCDQCRRSVSTPAGREALRQMQAEMTQ